MRSHENEIWIHEEISNSLRINRTDAIDTITNFYSTLYLYLYLSSNEKSNRASVEIFPLPKNETIQCTYVYVHVAESRNTARVIVCEFLRRYCSEFKVV